MVKPDNMDVSVPAGDESITVGVNVNDVLEIDTYHTRVHVMDKQQALDFAGILLAYAIYGVVHKTAVEGVRELLPKNAEGYLQQSMELYALRREAANWQCLKKTLKLSDDATGHILAVSIISARENTEQLNQKLHRIKQVLEDSNGR